jgi:hypothetical protein
MMSAHTLATTPAEERKRQEAIFELITTEYTFLHNMQCVVEASMMEVSFAKVDLCYRHFVIL